MGEKLFNKATLKTGGAPSGRQLLIRRLQMSPPVELTLAEVRKREKKKTSLKVDRQQIKMIT